MCIRDRYMSYAMSSRNGYNDIVVQSGNWSDCLLTSSTDVKKRCGMYTSVGQCASSDLFVVRSVRTYAGPIRAWKRGQTHCRL